MAIFTWDGDKLSIDGHPVIKAWESYSGWYWFATKDTGEKYKGYPIWFGFVQGFEEEWGEFTEAELRELPGKVWPIKSVDIPYSGRRT